LASEEIGQGPVLKLLPELSLQRGKEGEGWGGAFEGDGLLAAAAKEGELKAVSAEDPQDLGKSYLFRRLSEFITALAAERGGEEARAGKGEEDWAGGGFREAFFLGEVAGPVELIWIFRQVQKEAEADLEAFIDQHDLRIYTPSFQPANFGLAFTRKPFYHKAVFLVETWKSKGDMAEKLAKKGRQS
jgi:hypothetical protein